MLYIRTFADTVYIIGLLSWILPYFVEESKPAAVEESKAMDEHAVLDDNGILDDAEAMDEDELLEGDDPAEDDNEMLGHEADGALHHSGDGSFDTRSEVGESQDEEPTKSTGELL